MRMSRIRIGVVGLNFGRHIVKELTEGPGKAWFELAAVCDLDREKAAGVAAAHGVKAFSSIDDLLADDGIPAIGLFTGPVGRAGLISRIVRAGRDVMTTKPFETDPAAAYRVLREAEGLGRVVHLNSPAPLWPPDLAAIQHWRREHDLGRPVACNLAVWVRYREEAKGDWYDDPAQCPVAPVFRLGIYLINDMVRLLGEAERVNVVSSRLFTGRPTADNGLLSLRFRSGAVGSVFASFCVEDGDIYRNSMVLNFERGTVYRNVGALRRTQERGKMGLALVMGSNDGGSRVVAETTVSEGSGAYQWEAFARAVRGEKLADAVTKEEVVAGLRVLEAMREAEAGGGTVAVRAVSG